MAAGAFLGRVSATSLLATMTNAAKWQRQFNDGTYNANRNSETHDDKDNMIDDDEYETRSHSNIKRQTCNVHNNEGMLTQRQDYHRQHIYDTIDENSKTTTTPKITTKYRHKKNFAWQTTMNLRPRSFWHRRQPHDTQHINKSTTITSTYDVQYCL